MWRVELPSLPETKATDSHGRVGTEALNSVFVGPQRLDKHPMILL
jgi:hypothetical protein